MIYATDLSYSDVRSKYVEPLLNELLKKSGLTDVFTSIERLAPSEQSSLTISETLFDDIASSENGTRMLFTGGDSLNSRSYNEVSYVIETKFYVLV